MELLTLEKNLMENKSFMVIVEKALEEYNEFCFNNGMKECIICMENLWVEEFQHSHIAMKEFYTIFFEDVLDNKVVAIISIDLFNNKCERIL